MRNEMALLTIAAGLAACSGSPCLEVPSEVTRPAIMEAGGIAPSAEILPPRRGFQGDTREPHGARRLPRRVPPSAPHRAPISIENSKWATGAPTCTSSDLRGVHGDNLVKYLQSASYACLGYLWTWDGNVHAALDSDDNVIAVAVAIAGLSPGYDGTTVGGMQQLVFFVRAAYYWSFYQSYSLSPQTLQGVTGAFDAFARSPGFNANNQAAAQVLDQWINGVDAAQLGARFLPQLTSILSGFPGARETDDDQQINAYDVEYLVARETHYPEFQAAVDAHLLGALQKVALEQSLFVPNTKYLIDNALFATGQILSRVTGQHDGAVGVLSGAMGAYPRLSEPYLWSNKELSLYNGCHTSDPKVTICFSGLIPEVLARIVPNTFSFDDGAIRIQTALDLPAARILDQAAHQVQSQYSRLAQDLLPVPGDPNGQLRALIYASRDDFETYQPLLFDLDPGNGGIYIEQRGTIYSYQRTPSESIYTMEELFRHEYVHYLIERYDVPGMWGETPLYDGNRMVWFDEGMAEFLGGSSPQGVQVRKTLVSLVQGDGRSRSTLAQLFRSSYGDFKFYRYGGLFFDYLYANDRAKILALLRAAHDGDTAGFDAMVSAMGSDAALEARYQSFLDSEIAKLDGLTNPSTVVPPVDMSAGDLSAVQNAFGAAVGGNPRCTVSSLSLDGHFVCQGEIAGSLVSAPDTTAAGIGFDRTMNDHLRAAGASSLVNLHALDCRFGAVQFIPHRGQSYPLTTYYCDGPLGAGAPPYAPPAEMVQSDFRASRTGINTSCTANGSSEVDCRNTIASRAYDLSVGDDVLVAELTRDMNRAWEQVYGGRPAFYRDLTCSFSGPPTVAPVGTTQKHALVQVTCVVKTSGL